MISAQDTKAVWKRQIDENGYAIMPDVWFLPPKLRYSFKNSPTIRCLAAEPGCATLSATKPSMLSSENEASLDSPQKSWAPS